MTASPSDDMRRKNLERLEADGFSVAGSLPVGPPGSLRPIGQIAKRLWAMNVLVIFVSDPQRSYSGKDIRQAIDANGLAAWMSEDETTIVETWRWLAKWLSRDSAQWYIENMLSLAWILGFGTEPSTDGKMLNEQQRQSLVVGFLGSIDKSVSKWQKKCQPRSEREVVAMEDLFYCTHNAVRSAQFGATTVPEGFDPIANGGVIHERRHALTWALSPGENWDEIDLST